MLNGNLRQSNTLDNNIYMLTMHKNNKHLLINTLLISKRLIIIPLFFI